MARIEGSIYCDRCGAEITWAPYAPPAEQTPKTLVGVAHQADYCCQECYEGKMCDCAAPMDIGDV